MQYISPFQLLGIDISEISKKPDSINVSFLRKKLLAEFELTNAVTIETQAGELSKNDVLIMLDQLQDPAILNYHVQIAKDPVLMDFLQFNALEGTFSKNPVYNEESFLRFISRYFAHSYCTLVNFILDNENESNSFLYRIPLLISPGEELKWLQPIRKKIYGLIGEIEKYADEFAKGGNGIVAVDRKLFGFNIIRIFNILDYSLFEHDIEAYTIATLKLINESIDGNRSTFRDNELVYYILKQIENLKLSPSSKEEVKRYLSAFKRTPEENEGVTNLFSIIYIIVVFIICFRAIMTCESGSTNKNSSLSDLISSSTDTLNDTDSIRHLRVFNYLNNGYKVVYAFGREGEAPEFISFKTGENPYTALQSLDIAAKGKRNCLKIVNNSDKNVLGLLNSNTGNAFVFVNAGDSIVIGTDAAFIDIFFAVGNNWDKTCKVPRIIWPGQKIYTKDIYGFFKDPVANQGSLTRIIQVRFLKKSEKNNRLLRRIPSFKLYNHVDSVKIESFLPHKILEKNDSLNGSYGNSLNPNL